MKLALGLALIAFVLGTAAGTAADYLTDDFDPNAPIVTEVYGG